MNYYDFIIVGSGLAGLYAAYKASKHGRVAIVTKSGITESNSYFAQGGIASVTAEGDAPSLHFDDTIVAGRDLCDYPAVNILVNEGPKRIQTLIKLGMQFDMTDGHLALGLEGGHHQKRILHAGGDATGRLVTSFMISKVMQCKNIDIFENRSVLEILKTNNTCYGVRAWNINTEEEEIFLGNNTFLTLGGTSAIYERTTNPNTTIGDGIALAYQAGCEIEDMEFIQFHPTAIYTDKVEAFLISEAVRGEGAYLINQDGERFMPAIHELAELAPRDVVSQAIYSQMMKHHQNFVWMSLKHLDAEKIRKRFPTINEKCQQLGINMCDRIPVAPAAHYTVGGVKTNLNGATNINRLYVTGELAYSGIMGANRLASNSLIECLVFGYRAVNDACKNIKPNIIPEFKPKFYNIDLNLPEYVTLKKNISKIMTCHAGIIRSESSLLEGLGKLNKLKTEIGKDDNEYYTLISDNIIQVAKLIIQSALFRKESRGGHFREDYPVANDKYIYHIIQQKGKAINTIPVNTEMDTKITENISVDA